MAAASIYEQASHMDQRRYYFELLAAGVLNFNGKPIQEHEIYHESVLQTLREISQMGDGLYVRSVVERIRIESTFKRTRLHVATAPTLNVHVPNVRSHPGANHIVVWAPDEQAIQLAAYSYALWYMKMPVVFVCRGEIPNSPHRFISSQSGADALAEAAVVIDTELIDPGTAIALAGRGFGVAAAVTSGASEYIQGIATYQGHDFASILSAVNRIRADRRTYALRFPDALQAINSTLLSVQVIIPEDPPLVSIVVPTYNRVTELQKCLDLLAKQTYPNLEVVVVNDCGADVSSVVEQFSFARYYCTPKNGGCCASVNFGFRRSRGAFLGSVADDDCFYPNHISLLVAALSASDVCVAHSNIILRHETRLDNGNLVTYGHRLDHDGNLDCFEMHWADTHMSMQSYLIRREVYEQTGFLDEGLIATADIDSTIKLAKVSDFVHVDIVTGEMGCRDDRSSVASRLGEELATELHRVLVSHAPPESEIIAQRIEAIVGSIACAARAGVTHDSPWVRLSNPIVVKSHEHSY
jgi:hypothetical protein